jgi:hypothetical protein
MLKERFTRIVVSVIAVSLAILALNAVLTMISSSAQAQRPYNLVITEGPGKDVLLIRDIAIPTLQNIHILGDNKTFIVQKKDGFAVYTVEQIERNTK